MIRDINSKYKNVRKRARNWEAMVVEFNEKSEALKAVLLEPITQQTLLEMGKFAEALPSEMRMLKIESTKEASHVNCEVFRTNVRLRSNNGFVDLSPLSNGRDIVSEYLDLASNMIEYTLKELNANRTETNAHKAICLSRDVARFTSYVEDGVWEPIYWEKLKPSGDYLSDMFSLDQVKERLIRITSRNSVKGVNYWNLNWEVERLGFAINALQSLVERITEFGIARLELTPEQLDAIENK